MINANFLNGFWQCLALPVQILRYVLLFPIAVAMSLIGIIFAPIIALFVDSNGNLPSWLRWFQTPDATMYDVQWVTEHPTWSKYRIAMTWSMRNPAYGFLQWLSAKSSGGSITWGNVNADSSNSTGLCYIESDNGVWQLNIVWKLPLVSWCVIHSFGWNIKATGLTAGAYILAPIRFYKYTGK